MWVILCARTMFRKKEMSHIFQMLLEKEKTGVYGISLNPTKWKCWNSWGWWSNVAYWNTVFKFKVQGSLYTSWMWLNLISQKCYFLLGKTLFTYSSLFLILLCQRMNRIWSLCNILLVFHVVFYNCRQISFCGMQKCSNSHIGDSPSKWKIIQTFGSMAHRCFSCHTL